ncbi:MAG: amidohydrolase family protein, partial [Cyclobacteriaceae bacterium]|nr:amidohydrolase family protein [Cyclobacteriaceae bacterium]
MKHNVIRRTNRLNRMVFKKIIFFSLVLLLVTSCASKKNKKFDLLILNASIIDVEGGNVHPNKLIGISKDTIRLVDDMSNIDQFDADQMLDAKDNYVMPGLWDMHVHFRGGDSLINENKAFLPLFLAFGITTVRDAGGDITPSVLDWRAQINNSTLIGPTIFTSGPKLDGVSPAWAGSIQVVDAESVQAALDSLEFLDVDYVKMYDGSLTKEMFYEIIKEAKKRGFKTTGHMPLSANILEALQYGLNGSEHIYYTLKACSPLADSLTQLNIGYGMVDQLIASYDDQLADQVFLKMRDNNMFITPTLHIGKTLAEVIEVNHSADSLLPYIGKGIQQTYQGRIDRAKKAKAKGSVTRKKTEQQT